MPASPADQNDELLLPFLQAFESEEEAALEALLQYVQPILYAALQRKGLHVSVPDVLKEDLLSAMTLRILEQLRRYKGSYLRGDASAALHNFPALCKTIANRTISDYLRLKYPRRASLQNQVLYIIRETKDGNKQPLFAWWQDLEERLCGFHAWQGSPLRLTPSHHLLETNPNRALQKILPAGDARKYHIESLLSALLKWLGSPVSLDATVRAIGQWQGIEEVREVAFFQASSEEGFAAFQVASPDLSPEQCLLLNEHLRELWRDITGLPPKQCAALLLNLCDAQGRGVLGFFPALRIATFAQIAAAMDMELQEFTALWPQLPLNDRQIAALYECGVASVSVWRSRARAHLVKKSAEARANV